MVLREWTVPPLNFFKMVLFALDQPQQHEGHFWGLKSALSAESGRSYWNGLDEAKAELSGNWSVLEWK